MDGASLPVFDIVSYFWRRHAMDCMLHLLSAAEKVRRVLLGADQGYVNSAGATENDFVALGVL